MVTARRVLMLTLTVLAFVAATAAAQMPQSTTQQIPGAPVVTTQHLRGEVVLIEGNNVVVKLANGELKTIHNVPESRRIMVDGKEVGIHDLQVGTQLTATTTTITTPITVRTVTVGSGQVRAVSGDTVVLLLPNGDMKTYKVKPDFKFMVDGKEASVYELRPGMTVSAQKITEEPSVEINANTVVTGHVPPPPPAPAPVAEPAPAAAPAPVEAPKKLPKTGSPVPLEGLLGLAFVAGSYAIRKFRG